MSVVLINRVSRCRGKIIWIWVKFMRNICVYIELFNIIELKIADLKNLRYC